MQIVNFRDLGGMKTVHGQVVRHHQLLRSGQLVHLDDKTKRMLVEDYKLTRIVDFRRPFEINETPDDDIEGTTYTNIDLLGMIGAKNVSLDDFASLGHVSKVNGHMLGTYHDMVLNPGAQKGFAQFLDLVLTNESGSTDFHCFAGKDRTGFAAALMLWLLEVNDDTIMEDYLKTNNERVEANDELLEQFRAKGYDQDSLDALAVALYVKEEYLVYARKLIDDEYGDVLVYADKALGFGPEKVKAFRTKLLEG